MNAFSYKYGKQSVSKKQSENKLVVKKQPDSEIGLKKAIVINILNHIPKKESAFRCGVSQQQIRQWASGEKPIPTMRMYQIIKEGKDYIGLQKADLNRLESEIDMMMMLQFGRVE